jgi:hypothetical protein
MGISYNSPTIALDTSLLRFAPESRPVGSNTRAELFRATEFQINSSLQRPYGFDDQGLRQSVPPRVAKTLRPAYCLSPNREFF